MAVAVDTATPSERLTQGTRARRGRAELHARRRRGVYVVPVKTPITEGGTKRSAQIIIDKFPKMPPRASAPNSVPSS